MFEVVLVAAAVATIAAPVLVRVAVRRSAVLDERVLGLVRSRGPSTSLDVAVLLDVGWARALKSLRRLEEAGSVAAREVAGPPEGGRPRRVYEAPSPYAR